MEWADLGMELGDPTAFILLNRRPAHCRRPSHLLSPMEGRVGSWAKRVPLVRPEHCPPDTQVNYSLLADICNLWRNYDDIQDSWKSVLSIVDWFVKHQDVLQPVAGPGSWNDPDMVPLPTARGSLPSRTHTARS